MTCFERFKANCFVSLLSKLCTCIFLFPLFFCAFGPLEYFRATIFNSDALLEKYAKEGVRTKGRVVKRLEKDDRLFAIVAYNKIRSTRGRRGNYFLKKLPVNLELSSQDELDLVVLPEYPKSAILYEEVRQHVEFTHDSGCFRGAFALLSTIMMHTIPVLTLFLIFFDEKYTVLIAPVLFGTLVLGFTLAYCWLAPRERNKELTRRLLGAAEYPRGEQAEDQVLHLLSYEEVVGEERIPCCTVPVMIAKDGAVLCCALVALCLILQYFFLFLGGFLVMYKIVVPRRSKQLLDKYAAQGMPVTGTVVYRRTEFVRVSYKFQFVEYQKHFVMKQRRVREVRQRMFRREVIPDEPDLRVLDGYPASAQLQSRIVNRAEEYETAIGVGRIAAPVFVLLSYTIFVFIVFTVFFPPILDRTLTLCIVVGCSLGLQILLGYLGVRLYYHCFIYRELVYGAKERQTWEGQNLPSQEEISAIDEGVQLNTVVETETIASASEGGDHSDYIKKFMGQFPHMDRTML